MANLDSPQTGYILHSRPYRDTSLIVDCFIKTAGRVSLLFKGVRKVGRTGAKMHLLQPFRPLLIQYQGKGELKNGREVEPIGIGVYLQGRQLYSGLYLNELLVRLLVKEEPHEQLYESYQRALHELTTLDIELALRRFEWCLLKELGFELVLETDTSGDSIQPDSTYLYIADTGLEKLPGLAQGSGSLNCFQGEHLIKMANNDYSQDEVLQTAKRLSRLALAPHLGEKPLSSRQLFATLKSNK